MSEEHIHELASLAYARELQAALDKLSPSYTDWLNEESCNEELNARILDYHIAWCTMYKRYKHFNAYKALIAGAAYAIENGIINESEVDSECLEIIKNYEYSEHDDVTCQCIKVCGIQYHK
ncbi:MAG: hypothetical protein D6B28_10590 [Gammaproteobacteria bacterium]|nr:MAG: hypothetical protein D6B28_10590 [Gammaproteobacteria bacterium]